MKIAHIICLSLFGLCISSLQAQWRTVQPRLGTGLYLGAPVDEYAEATNGTGAGVNGRLMFPLAPRVPFYAGAEFGYMLFGSNTQRETLSADVTANGVVIDRIDIPLRVRTNNNIYFWHLMFRAQAPLPVIQPYVQAMVGFRYMTTNTKIFDDSPDGAWSNQDNGLIVEQQQLSDYVGSYGFGAGLMIPLGRSVMLDGRVDFLYGGKARYYDGEDTEQWQLEFVGDPSMIDELNGDVVNVSTTPRESFTNMYTFTLGISFLLGGNNQLN